MFWQLSGAVLVGLATVWMAVMLARAIGRMRGESHRRKLELARLETELEMLRDSRRRRAAAPEPWSGVRKFVVKQRVAECDGICSFYLAPHDGRPLPEFKPGQYLTFPLKVPGQPKLVTRCYSLSDAPRPDYYRVSIKRVAPAVPGDAGLAAGVGSGFFHDQVKQGDILDVKAPAGHFCLEATHERPVVLIGGGIGLTPVLSMLNALVRTRAEREIWFIYALRHGGEHVQREHLRTLAKENPNLRLQICYSQPRPEDVPGRDFHHAGRANTEFLKKLLPSNNYDFFICGPGPMMEELTKGLADWGVPDTAIFYEAFGPASVKRAAKPPEKAGETSQPEAGVDVTFAKSGRTLVWDGKTPTLLEFAEQHGVPMDSGCRAGNCGTCVVAVKAGAVDYLAGHGASAEPGTCLACVCKPREKLVIDA
jgi:ferredoxin-NADP reductase